MEATNVTQEPEPQLSAYFEGLVDVVTDDAGEINYLINNGKNMSVQKSYAADGVVYVPPALNLLPFRVPQLSPVLKWYKKDDDRTLFRDIVEHFQKFSFVEAVHLVLLACYTMLTYLFDHEDVHYLGEILFHAAPERGKSRTGKTLIHLSFRGIHLAEVREATLLRYAQDSRATLFFDTKNFGSIVERKNCVDIILGRFEKGLKVARVHHPQKGPFKDIKLYRVFGATVIATNEPVDNVLETRCIPIPMPNRPGHYADSTFEISAVLRERITAFRARNMFESLPKLPEIEGLEGRLQDMAAPILQICQKVCPEHFRHLFNAFIEISDQKKLSKRETIEADVIASIIQVLPTEDNGYTDFEIESAAVLSILNEGRTRNNRFTPQWLGLKVKTLGLKIGRRKSRSILILKKEEIEALKVQYGLAA
ncbi:MAG: hypothetical protein ABSB95_01040 [Dissulfurispiraceae bacterium]|jgi:hypothetical protein